MIKNKIDLRHYILEDQRVYGYPFHHSIWGYFTYWLFPDLNLQFLCCLRHLEYYLNCVGGVYLGKSCCFATSFRFELSTMINQIKFDVNTKIKFILYFD